MEIMVEVMVVMEIMVEVNMTRIKSFLPLAALLFITGCSFSNPTISDNDRDGVADYKDICKSTPSGSKVDKYGCALDQDFDGIIDLYDKCPNTTASQLVDKNGCMIEKI